MISKVECFVVECDGCGEVLTDNNDFSIFPDQLVAQEKVNNEVWHKTEDGKHYCHKCHHFDDNNQLVMHPQKPTP